ncbi:MAG: type I-C CRISPR-associated protein Cas7/Csd2 [Anaerococcus sp.]|nr:type I-C CRISPR-associated protein Cas7/Csd2 [Anaerococcus sp.]
MINNKIDFIVTIEVDGANPNGDPLAGNMPRLDSFGYGQISDVAIKRKIRNRMQDLGAEIFVKSAERSDDGFNSLESRFSSTIGKSEKDPEKIYEKSCKTWVDVRSFGHVVTYNNNSVGIRGPVSISIAQSLEPIDIVTMQITKSVNGKESKTGRSSDTIGSKHYINQAIYVFYGSINSYFSEKTGFDEKDADLIKEAIRTLFVNDASTARPEGSMLVKDIFWFNHSSKIGDVSSGKIKDLLEYEIPENISYKDRKYEDYKIGLNEEKLEEVKKAGVRLEHIEGM